MGFNGAAWGIAAIVAPLLGGFIVDQLTWHWVFFINIPIGLLTVAMIALYLHEDPHTVSTKIDYLGTLWLTMALLSLMYGFQVLGETNFTWQTVETCFAVTVVAIFLFIRREQKADDPIISLKLFKNRTFITQNLATMLVSGFLIGFEVYIPTWTQGLLGLPASLAGFAVTPSSVMWIFGSFLAGKFILKLTPKQTLMISLAILFVGSLWLALLSQTTPFWLFFVISTILGVGFGITITSTTVTSQRLVEAKDMGVATSFNTLARTLGQTIMMSIFGIIMNGTMNKGIAQHSNLNLGMMNKLINPQTASSLPAKLLPTLRTILYQALHNIYLAGVCLIILAIVINAIDYRKKQRI